MLSQCALVDIDASRRKSTTFDGVETSDATEFIVGPLGRVIEICVVEILVIEILVLLIGF